MIEAYADRIANESLADVATHLVAHIRYQDDLTRQYPEPNELAIALGLGAGIDQFAGGI